MNQAKYIGMNVHQATISVAVMDSAGKLILESILETKAPTILQFLGGLGGSLLVTFEEGTSAVWSYELLKPHVADVLVCDPRRMPYYLLQGWQRERPNRRSETGRALARQPSLTDLPRGERLTVPRTWRDA